MHPADPDIILPKTKDNIVIFTCPNEQESVWAYLMLLFISFQESFLLQLQPFIIVFSPIF